jgi:tripartite-type tricarboxylate transporter receptor subunit TctC
MHPQLNRRHALHHLMQWSAGLGAIAASPWAAAQHYPAKPVKVLVGAAPGGPADFLARVFSDVAAPALGQPFVVDNKAGATGTLAAGLAARAPADGYALMAGAPTAVVTAPHLIAKLDYDPEKDFVPVTMLGAGAFVLAVHPSLPVNSVQDLIALARRKASGLNFGSGGNGSSGQLCMEAFTAQAGIEMLHVPYRGDGPASVDLLGGQIQLMFTAPNVALTHHQSGKLRIIAVSSRERMPSLPDVPSVHETLPGFEYYGWIILFAPAGTPQAVVDSLARTWNQARNQPAVKAKLDGLGMFPPAHYAGQDALQAFLKSERQRTQVLVKKLGITPA